LSVISKIIDSKIHYAVLLFIRQPLPHDSNQQIPENHIDQNQYWKYKHSSGFGFKNDTNYQNYQKQFLAIVQEREVYSSLDGRVSELSLLFLF
jgi:hypothetical protein